MSSPLSDLQHLLPLPHSWLMTMLLTLLRKQKHQMKTPTTCITCICPHVFGHLSGNCEGTKSKDTSLLVNWVPFSRPSSSAPAVTPLSHTSSRSPSAVSFPSVHAHASVSPILIDHRQEVLNKCLCAPVLSTSPASGSSVGSEQAPLLPSPSTISTDGAGEAGKGTSSPEQAAGRRRLFQRVVTHLSHPASRPFCTSCMSSI